MQIVRNAMPLPKADHESTEHTGADTSQRNVLWRHQCHVERVTLALVRQAALPNNLEKREHGLAAAIRYDLVGRGLDVLRVRPIPLVHHLPRRPARHDHGRQGRSGVAGGGRRAV